MTYIKRNHREKLEAVLSSLFQILHQMGKQSYYSKSYNWCRIYDLFYLFLLEENF